MVEWECCGTGYNDRGPTVRFSKGSYDADLLHCYIRDLCLSPPGTSRLCNPPPVCGTPLDGFGVMAAMGKAFGMSAGAGNAPNAIALIGPSLTGPETKPRLRQ